MKEKQVFDMHPLFEAVQLRKVFPDTKTFVDCTLRYPATEIMAAYDAQHQQPDFDLRHFVEAHFDLPKRFASDYRHQAGQSTAAHIHALWDTLTREPDQQQGSLIPLPHPYIVPGGRFGEIYYWDSYFTMLGLSISGKKEMLAHMVANFSCLIKEIGFIPNGNRTYYQGRSQPPFFASMVRLLVGADHGYQLADFIQPLQQEYDFWMRGKDGLTETTPALQHVVLLPGAVVLNRYYDAFDSPRPESYREDVELSHQSAQSPSQLYRHLRAGAESGWDYSSRWFKDGIDFTSIHTADIVPVDLNCLLYHLEYTLSEAYLETGNLLSATHYSELAQSRKAAIQQYCWNDALGFYVDYDAAAGEQQSILTLAAAFPLYFSLASQDQAASVAAILGEHFLRNGGFITTLQVTGQQWDAPNGWAPLQWMTVCGLDHYGFHALAREAAQRWLKLNDDVYRRTGKMMEKYNVVDTHLEAGGGEYEGQDGFGWTNGVYLALQQRYGQQ